MKETKQFQTESKQLLQLMIHSIYSDSEVFLRELISNASDAIDKYRILAAGNGDAYPASAGEIRLSFDKDERTITIQDNGVGMNKEDLENDLGTIARSGSKAFVEEMKNAKKDANIIGQFGVGFYSAFIVASSVEVISKKHGEPAYSFTSDGCEEYSIEDAELDEDHGTKIVLHLKPNEDEADYDSYLSQWRIQELVKKYSDYIGYPIKMNFVYSRPDKEENGEYSDSKFHDEIEEKTLNSMVPLWKKSKKDRTEEELNKFYKEKFHDGEDPLAYVDVSVEGMLEYKALLFLPKHAPYNLYSENYEKGYDLYAKGVFVQEKCKALVPDYLKFVKGVVDSEDFSLNISREMLQNSPTLKKIADNLEKKVVDRLKTMLEKESDKYVEFYKAFGDHLKFGIYSTYGGKKDMLQDLLMFHSLQEDKLITLKSYVEKMGDKKTIHYASGKSIDLIKALPQIERYKKNGEDVLLFDHPVDEFAIMMIGEYEKHPFKNIADDNEEDVSEETKKELEEKTVASRRLLDDLKESLQGKVSDVVLSSKLVDAPCCISTKEGMSLSMEDTLSEQAKALNQEGNSPKAEKVLEINPSHPLYEALSAVQDQDEAVKEYGSILYEEALLLEGREIEDKATFLKKINELMLKALKK